MPDDTGADLLLTDDLMPNEGGEAFDVSPTEELDPEEKTEREESSLVRGNSKLLEKLFDWFDKEIAATDSNKVIMAYAKRNAVSHETAALAFELVRGLLEDKRQQLVDMQEVYDPKK